MKDAAAIRAQAKACLVTSMEMKAWGKNERVVSRYARIPEALASRLARADELEEAAKTLNELAGTMGTSGAKYANISEPKTHQHSDAKSQRGRP